MVAAMSAEMIVNMMTVKNKEQWKPIKGYEGLYEVSDKGRIRSTRRPGAKGGIMKQYIDTRDYPGVQLTKQNVGRPHKVHRLVAKAFCKGFKSRSVVNHKNGNKKDNRAENLEWCSEWFNKLHAYNMLGVNKGEKNGRAKFTQREVDFIRYIVGLYPDIQPLRIAEFYGTSGTAVNDILTFKKWPDVRQMQTK